MKVVILAGGLGTRIAEETSVRPKPMVEIGGKPILWHIMKIYSSQGFNEFVICLGYKGYYIKEWFSQYYLHKSDVTFDLENNQTIYHKNSCENWKVTLVDTGDNTMTGGRIKRVEEYLGGETFMATYGDGVSDVNLSSLIEAHKKHGKLATLTSVVPAGRFGILKVGKNKKIDFFGEKVDNIDRVNGGFFVLEPGVLDYISGDEMPFEQDPLVNLVKDGELYSYEHNGFWKPMDTLGDKNELEKIWNTGEAPWKTWKD